MLPYFTELGDRVLERWQAMNFSLTAFPALAEELINECPPHEEVDLSELMEDFLSSEHQPRQGDSGFGQPEIIAYDHPRFYIQLLFWMDGTTAIHQHEFSGVFHVMHGSSIHALYDFKEQAAVTPHLKVGEVQMQSIELLETGRTVRIVSGQSCIHSLFHLDNPSVTVVLRTQNDPGTGPQYNYLPPGIAMDPMHSDTLTTRRKQMLEVLEQWEMDSYGDMVLAMLQQLDFERGFFILQHSMSTLQALGAWEDALAAFCDKHGDLAKAVPATLREGVRREGIKAMRGMVTDPEQRFFLALLMNVNQRQELLKLVAQAYPDEPAVERVMLWTEQLCEEMPDGGATLLEAILPEAKHSEDPEEMKAALKPYLVG